MFALPMALYARIHKSPPKRRPESKKGALCTSMDHVAAERLSMRSPIIHCTQMKGVQGAL